MAKIHLIITPEQAERYAAGLDSEQLDVEAEAEAQELAAQAARLRHLAAKARARDAAHAGT